MIPVQGFIGGAYALPSKNIADQQCINLMLESVDTVEKAPASLVHAPGFTNHFMLGFTSALNYSPRIGGMIRTASGRLFVLIGNSFLECSSVAASASQTGYIAGVGGVINSMYTTITPVAMMDNLNGILIVDGTAQGYWFFKYSTGIVSQIVDGALTSGATTIGYLDQSFIIDKAGTNSYQVSPVSWNGVTAWDVLAVGSCNQSSDFIKNIIVNGGDVWMLNSDTIEIWYDAETTPNPLARNTSVSINIGVHAYKTALSLNNSVFWLGGGANGYGIVYMSNGFTPQRISTTALEQVFLGYSDISDAFALGYQAAGHIFYCLTFRTDKKTWVFDASNGQWHQRGYLNPVTGAIEAWRPIAIGFLNGELYGVDAVVKVRTNPNTGATDLITTAIVRISRTIYTEAGEPLLKLRSSPHGFSNWNRIFYSRFQLDIETGAGLTTGQGSSPLVRLRYSDDAGHTYGNFRFRTFGAIGKYLTRVIWDRLGQSRSRVWEISTSEPVPVRIMGAWMEAEEGTN